MDERQAKDIVGPCFVTSLENGYEVGVASGKNNGSSSETPAGAKPALDMIVKAFLFAPCRYS